MKLVLILTILILAACGSTWERRIHPCGFSDGEWVYHKALRENVIIDSVDKFWTRAGESYPLRCSDIEAAR